MFGAKNLSSMSLSQLKRKSSTLIWKFREILENNAVRFVPSKTLLHYQTSVRNFHGGPFSERHRLKKNMVANEPQKIESRKFNYLFRKTAMVEQKPSFMDRLNIFRKSEGNNIEYPKKRSESSCSNEEQNMEKDNLTAVLYGIEDLRLEQRPIPEIANDEVLLEMDTVGICGSDVHFLTHGRIGDFVLKKPMVIGHEASGIVAEVGNSVKHLKVGDRVAIEPGVPCRYCDFCKAGQYNMCPGMAFCATPPTDGNLTRYFKHAADFCYKLPDHVTMEEGALMEPLSVSVHACRRGGVGLGSKVLVLGAGPIGLVTLLTAQAMGASKIMITDLIQSRLDVAKELGATHTLLLTRDDKAEEVVKRVKKLMGELPDKTIECCGAETTTRLGIFATRSGGCLVLVGIGALEMKVPLINALCREVNIRGVFRYCNDYPGALAMIASGNVNVKRLVTHHYNIEETAEAFETSRYGTDGAIKVLIHVQPRDTNNKKINCE